MKDFYLKFIINPFLFFIFIQNCIPISLLQSPKVIDKGKSKIDAGITFFYYIPFAEWFIAYRYGLGLNTDFGIKIFDPFISNFPYWCGLQIDLKHQFSDNPPYVSFDFASSLGYGMVGEEYVIIGEQKLLTYSFSPSLILGGERFYVACRVINWYSYSKKNNSPWIQDIFLWYGMSVGHKFLIGEKSEFILELSFMEAFKNELFIFPALCFGMEF